MKLVIFDLDGTLIDTNDLHRQSFQYALQIENLAYVLNSYDEEYLEGRPSLAKVDYLRTTYGWELDTARIYKNKQQYTLENLNTIGYDPTIITSLNNLKFKASLALASNARSQFVFRVLNLLKLDVFDIVLTANYVPRAMTKPNPFMFLECMRLSGIQPHNTIIFEDSKVGIDAANASGATCIEVTNSTDTGRKIQDLICKL